MLSTTPVPGLDATLERFVASHFPERFKEQLHIYVGFDKSGIPVARERIGGKGGWVETPLTRALQERARQGMRSKLAKTSH